MWRPETPRRRLASAFFFISNSSNARRDSPYSSRTYLLPRRPPSPVDPLGDETTTGTTRGCLRGRSTFLWGLRRGLFFDGDGVHQYPICTGVKGVYTKKCWRNGVGSVYRCLPEDPDANGKSVALNMTRHAYRQTKGSHAFYRRSHGYFSYMCGRISRSRHPSGHPVNPPTTNDPGPVSSLLKVPSRNRGASPRDPVLG